MQVYLMTAISFERYYILYKTININTMNYKMGIRYVIGSILLSFFWSTTPLLGWSHYSLEDGRISCTVEYKDRSNNVFSYNVSMFLFVFLIPFSLIILTNIKSFLIVIWFFLFIFGNLSILIIFFRLGRNVWCLSTLSRESF